MAKFKLSKTFKDASEDDLKERIWQAYKIIVECGQIDGAHHKDWVMDQAIRALIGDKKVPINATDYKGNDYTYNGYNNDSKVYRQFVKFMQDGEDGPHTYSYDAGIAP